jgi:hypothetical protein
MIRKPGLRTCVEGHQYHKSSDCPVCPLCESQKKSQIEFLNKIGAPARRALEQQGIQNLKQVAKYSERELLALHGVGPNAVRRLKIFLDEQRLSFKKD